MKPFLASLCLLLATLNLSQAQPFTQHFPHGQKLLFLKADGSDTAVHQMIYDSSYVSVQDPNGNGKLLFHTGQRHFVDCPTLSPNVLDAFNEYVNSDLAYFRFEDSADIFSIDVLGTLLVEIKTSLSPGSSHTFGNKTLILTQKSWYDANGIQDSALYFYPEKNGSPDFTKTPVIFGETRGWISGGNHAPFQQIGRIDEFGNYTGELSIPGWQDYFPEEAGDVKCWEIKKAIPPDPSFPIGRVDSFISVTRYPDSIRIKVREYTLLAGWTWEFRYEYEHTILPPKDLVAVLKQENFGRYWLPVPDQHPSADPVIMTRIHLDRSKDIFDIELISDGISSIEDSCIYQQVSDFYSSRSYSKQYGFMLKDHLQWGYNTEILIAAKVGNHQFGNLALSISEVASPVLNLYPNPTHSALLIRGDYRGAKYAIIDLAGATLLSGTLFGNSIAVDGLAEGTYILRIIQNDGSRVSGKFVKGVN
ncbi:MAG: T9SS type A sorting domain-containing protein [Bacteroidia bacterium]